ncbi:MAG: transglycosylase SLT domain-containing protein, partial [Dehalococcoidia bacterium]
RVTWDMWSWGAEVDPENTSPVRKGSHSLAIKFEHGWAGLGLRSSDIATGPYSHLRFALRTAADTLPALRVALLDGDGPIRETDVTPHAVLDDEGWYAVSIPLEQLGAEEHTVHGVRLQDASGGPVGTLYVDSLRLAGREDGEACAFRPLEASTEVDDAIRDAAAKYNLPRWFYYAIIQRESSFDPNLVGSHNDLGLTQMRGLKYTGESYPMGLPAPDADNEDYYWAMRFQDFGRWIDIHEVSPLTDPFDPRQNLDRFSTGYAVPAFHLFKRVYGLDSAEALRAVAYHWNKGVYVDYDPNNADYLGLYDEYVEHFKRPVEARDGAWDGRPALPGGKALSDAVAQR